jgi:hypothetical protein
MGVDHSRLQAGVAQKLLNDADVVINQVIRLKAEGKTHERPDRIWNVSKQDLTND